ncbi:MAG: hypothetical protein K8R77_10320 [Anaerolineaceae bacterium]|nr:hypothetical protein [Anaerolineaceae bacterium]
MPQIILHIQNEPAVIGEVDELPGFTDTMVGLRNPTRLDGKELDYLDQRVNYVVWPLSRLNFIEILPTGEEDEIISFVREK